MGFYCTCDPFDHVLYFAVWSQSRSDWWRINRLFGRRIVVSSAVLGSDDFDPIAFLLIIFRRANTGEAMTYVLLASGLEPSFNVL